MGAYSEEPEDPWSAQRWGQPPPPPAHPADLPATMQKAVELMYAGAVLTVVGAVLRLMAAGPEREVYGSNRSSGVTTGPQVLGALFGAAVAVLLWCWMANANREGKGWARSTATVFGVLAGIVVLTFDVSCAP